MQGRQKPEPSLRPVSCNCPQSRLFIHSWEAPVLAISRRHNQESRARLSIDFWLCFCILGIPNICFARYKGTRANAPARLVLEGKGTWRHFSQQVAARATVAFYFLSGDSVDTVWMTRSLLQLFPTHETPRQKRL